ncbi:hypothetical protein CLV84_1628 [Neolewinella xylanilytica]|uniref:Uncharacterized protein n=1 Tax=Neolewinella xylanilytica TaxID=1514080 RepID=A0A2S6IAY5_9BACT|nr:hypothetical protein CLV84_1628 [Neolewinella xylanilytica]
MKDGRVQRMKGYEPNESATRKDERTGMLMLETTDRLKD